MEDTNLAGLDLHAFFWFVVSEPGTDGVVCMDVYHFTLAWTATQWKDTALC